MSASASVSANPMYMLDRINPAASGCLAMASTPWPKIRPIPTPGPIAARPYATAPMLMLMMLWVVPAAAREWKSASMCAFLCDRAGGFPSAGRWQLRLCAIGRAAGRAPRSLITLMLRLDCTADVLGGQDREDVGLQRLDQHLEPGQHDREHERGRAPDQADADAEEIPGGDRKDQKQDVPG